MGYDQAAYDTAQPHIYHYTYSFTTSDDQDLYYLQAFASYENILSPQITGIVTIVSTSGAEENKEDTQKRVGSLYTSLPLQVGCELLMKIKDPIGEGIDFASPTNPHKKLYINEVQIIDKSSSSEIIQLRLN